MLQGVDLDIETGQTTTIIGGSGSGKSVLFKHIIGLMKPDSGSILVDGEDITTMGESDLYRMVDKFGLVFQSGALFDSMTVGENVAFGMKKRKDMTPAAIAPSSSTAWVRSVLPISPICCPRNSAAA